MRLSWIAWDSQSSEFLIQPAGWKEASMDGQALFLDLVPGSSQRPNEISGDHAVWMSQRIQDGDFTIRGLVVELSGRGLKVDYHSVWDFVHAEKFS
jgi:transposase